MEIICELDDMISKFSKFSDDLLIMEFLQELKMIKENFKVQ